MLVMVDHAFVTNMQEGVHSLEAYGFPTACLQRDALWRCVYRLLYVFCVCIIMCYQEQCVCVCAFV